jgi:hypothetical protein
MASIEENQQRKRQHRRRRNVAAYQRKAKVWRHVAALMAKNNGGMALHCTHLHLHCCKRIGENQ